MAGDDRQAVEKRAWISLFGGLSAVRSVFAAGKYGLQIVGTIMAGFAGFMIEGKQEPVLHYFQAFGVLGLVLVAAGVIIDWRIGDRFTDALVDTRAAIDGWSDEIRLKEEALAKARDAELLLADQLELASAFGYTMQFLEKALGTDSEHVDARLRTFLEDAGPQLVYMMRFDPRLDWTISVFLKQKSGRTQAMKRVADHWKSRTSAISDARTWGKGKGWTGEAWRRGESRPGEGQYQYVVERDAQTDDARQRYDTDGKEQPDDKLRFRSVCSIPFGAKPNSVDGVLTITSGQIGTFDVTQGTGGARNLAIAKNFAVLVNTLLIACSTER